MTLELLRAFRKAGVGHTFTLLTGSWCHEELAELDGPNMKRLQVIKERPFPTSSRMRFHGRAMRMVAHLARRIGRAVSRSRFGSFPLRTRNVSLLFCPFTAPTFSEPGIPVVSVIHDLQHRAYPDFFSSEEIAERDCFMAQAGREATCIVCVSESVKNSVISELGILPERIRVFPNVIQSRLGKIEPEAASERRRKLGLKHSFFFYPANYWPHKNHRMLLVAYGMLRSRLGDMTPDLVFTGASCPAEEDLREAALRMGLEKEIHFLGHLPENDFDAVWQGCFALVFPSLYEGFGIPLLEAMALGKPVLASEVTSLPEVGGEAAFYFDPRLPEEMAAAMEKVVTESARSEEMVVKGRARARDFSSIEVGRLYLELFEEVLTRPKPVWDGVTGVYPDGWTGAEVLISLTPREAPFRLVILADVPESLPHFRVEIRAHHHNGDLQSQRSSRGRVVRLSMELSERISWIILSISPVFRPVEWDMGPDTRLLGVKLRECWLMESDGRRVDLPLEWN